MAREEAIHTFQCPPQVQNTFKPSISYLQQYLYPVCITMNELHYVFQMVYPGHVKLTEKEVSNIQCYYNDFTEISLPLGLNIFGLCLISQQKKTWWATASPSLLSIGH